MSYVSGYSQIVNAVVPPELWEGIFFSLESLKAHCQAVPGYQRMDVLARDVDDSDAITLTVITSFEYQDQLDQWLQYDTTPDAVLHAFDEGLELLTVEVREIVG